jgi:hypothetical protein
MILAGTFPKKRPVRPVAPAPTDGAGSHGRPEVPGPRAARSPLVDQDGNGVPGQDAATQETSTNLE